MKTQTAPFKASLLLLVIAALLFGLIACKAQETNVPFETLEKREIPLGPDGKYYEGKEPKVFVIARADEIAKLESTVSLDARAQLHSLDYKQYLAIVVFRGLNQYQFEIERIGRDGNSVSIYAHFASPDLNLAQPNMQISPYQLVTLSKGELHGSIEFNLNADGRVVSQTVYAFP